MAISPLIQAGLGVAGTLGGNLISARGQSQGLEAAEGIMSNAFNINMLFDIMRNQEFTQAANQIAEAQEIKNAVSDRRGDAGEINRLANAAGVNAGPQLTSALRRASVEGTSQGLNRLNRHMTDADIAVRGISASQQNFNNRLSGQLSSAVQEGSGLRTLGQAVSGVGDFVTRSAIFRRPEEQVQSVDVTGPRLANRLDVTSDIDLGQSLDSQFLPPTPNRLGP